jgi:hypothetical protein
MFNNKSKLVENLNKNLSKDLEFKKLVRINNNWKEDLQFANYPKLGQKQKGQIGEHVVEEIMKINGHLVESPQNTGHDRIVDKIKTEIKFSLACSKNDKIIKDKFIINHVSIGKDWQRLIFCGINPKPEWGNMKVRKTDKLEWGRIRIVFMEKQDFVQYMNSDEKKIFKFQQGGEKVQNDDYICSNFLKFAKLPFVKDISEWK